MIDPPKSPLKRGTFFSKFPLQRRTLSPAISLQFPPFQGGLGGIFQGGLGGIFQGGLGGIFKKITIIYPPKSPLKRQGRFILKFGDRA